MPDHDMKVGPCSCGAWHGEGEFKPMLTDEQIIRTLAEFMGYPDRPLIPPDFHHPNWWMDGVMLPLYLTSYDALAPVCKKAWETVRVSTFGNAFRWWEMPPKALAEALATAILEAKEQS